MAKSANLYARIEPDLKEQAENILTALGIGSRNAERSQNVFSRISRSRLKTF